MPPKNRKTLTVETEHRRAQQRLCKKRKYIEIKSDPDLLAIEKEKRHNRYIQSKEDGRQQSINELTLRAQREQRKKWRENSKRYRQNKKEEGRTFTFEPVLVKAAEETIDYTAPTARDSLQPCPPDIHAVGAYLFKMPPKNRKTPTVETEHRRAEQRLCKKKKNIEIKSDPDLLAMKKEKRRNRYIQSKEDGRQQSINELTLRAQREQRKKWRENSKRYRQNKKEEGRTPTFEPVLVKAAEEIIDYTAPTARDSLQPCPPDIHAVVEEDMENYIKFKLVGGRLKLKKGVLPHKFECQKLQKKKIDRPGFKKRQDIEYFERVLSKDIGYEDLLLHPTEVLECENQDSTIIQNSDPLAIPEEVDVLSNTNEMGQKTPAVQVNIKPKTKTKSNNTPIKWKQRIVKKEEIPLNLDPNVVSFTISNSNSSNSRYSFSWC